jgi:hypothetical protein
MIKTSRQSLEGVGDPPRPPLTFYHVTAQQLAETLAGRFDLEPQTVLRVIRKVAKAQGERHRMRHKNGAKPRP